MISAGIYTFLSVLGMLWEIVSSYPKTAFGKILYNSTLFMGSTYFIIAIAAAISSLILRKKQKTKASIWVNVISLIYIAVVLAINSLAGKIL